MITELPPASIIGIGAITPLGRDLKVIAGLLDQSMILQSDVLRVSDEILADPAFSKPLRRADRFSRMATIAAVDACNAAKPACENIPLERIGMILSSGLGPHCRGFRFLDGLLDNGDEAASPTDFSHSVHGAALAYISGLQGFQGPSLTVTDFESGFEETVQLAQCWLADGSCDRVLIGAVEEVGEVMLHCTARMLKDDRAIIPGEGAVFLMLGPANIAGREQISTSNSPPIDSNATNTGSRFGHSASGVAFSVLSALLSKSPAGKVTTISTVRISSDPGIHTLSIKKT